MPLIRPVTCLRSVRYNIARSTSLYQPHFPSSTRFVTSTNSTIPSATNHPPRFPSQLQSASMSTFSNADTGSKPADPYKAANKDNASTEDKVTALDNFVSKCKFGMMTTRDPSTQRLVSRCMAVAAKEAGSLDHLFFTNTESHKTDELKNDPHVNISFLDTSGQWASVSGTTSIETDRELIKKYYSPSLKAWVGDLGDGTHDGSENDPRIGIIRVKMETATFAITDKTILGRLAEVAKGTVTGEAASVNKLREIDEAEVKAWRASH
ncbi:hypothetical protein F4780DRAFT_756428 [Xylariomycetidae sp. FL0641]|nr:hypothetical protein F4780DRAFT_756428 [Xylariomycetidae sp. FL0641]